jgi:D-arabinose 1-dehydrogenase-like Zn-dependent alcohol dehydrogenase
VKRRGVFKAYRSILSRCLNPGPEAPELRVPLVGGLGHLALQFLRNWGCEVYAFTSTDSKREEAIKLGAHQVINSRHDDELSKIRGALDMILVTVNVPLNWAAYLDCLAPKGVLRFVGVVPERCQSCRRR